MADAPVLGGKDKVALEDAVFGVPFNGPLVHEVVVAELNAKRRGTQATKSRSAVAGGNSKPWRQKGTGRARVGSIRNPIWTGGGHAFALQPRHYTVKVNRKVRRAALRCALSVHAERGSVAVLDAAGFEAPSTKRAVELLGDRAGGSVLVLLDGDQATAARSFRNLERVTVLPAEQAGVSDIVGHASLVLSREALEAVSERARKPVRGAVEEKGSSGEARRDDERSEARA